MKERAAQLKSKAAKLRDDHSKQKEAFECYHRAVQLDPDDPELWFRLGQIIDDAEIEEERYVRAQALRDIVSPGLPHEEFNQMRCFRKAVELDPKHLDALKRIAELFHVGEDHAKARVAFSRVLELVPDDVEVLCKKAVNCHNLAISGEEYREIALRDPAMLEEASDCYARAIEVNPGDAADWEAFYWMAEISLLKEDKRSALTWFSRQVEYTGDDYCRQERDKLVREVEG